MQNLDQEINLAKGEVFFVSVIATPLWKLIDDVYSGDFKEMVQNGNRNSLEWKKIKEREEN